MLEHNQYLEGRRQVDHSDLTTMGRDRREFRPLRWTPLWAMDDQKVRMVVYQYTWNYVSANSTEPKPGTPLIELEKIARTKKRAYVAERIANTVSDKDRLIQEEHLRTTENGIATRATMLIYKAYRERLTGPDIADLMQMSHENVRILLYRLNRIARNLFPESDCTKPHWSSKPVLVKKRRRIIRDSEENREFKAARRLQYLTDRNLAREARRRVKELAQAEKASYAEKLKEMAKQFNDGATFRELFLKSGVPPATLRHQMQKHGLQVRKRWNANRGIELTKEIADKYNAGATAGQLALEYKMNQQTLRNRLRKAGLVDPARPRPKSKLKTSVITPQLLKIAEMRKNKGTTFKVLAKGTGLSPVILRYRLVKLGLI